jgi:hypothetical protein
MLVSFVDLLTRAANDATARIGLGMILLLFLYTFGENLEILAYLFWPAMIFIGIGHQAPNRAGRPVTVTQSDPGTRQPAT